METRSIDLTKQTENMRISSPRRSRPRPRLRQIFRHGSLPSNLNKAADLQKEESTRKEEYIERGQLQYTDRSPAIERGPIHHFGSEQNLRSQNRRKHSSGNRSSDMLYNGSPNRTTRTGSIGSTEDSLHSSNKSDVAAYVLQPDGTVAAVRWDDKSALKSNAPVLSVLQEEQRANMYGKTSGKIQNASNSAAKLPSEVLDWLATEGDDDTFSCTYSDSSIDAGQSVPMTSPPLHQNVKRSVPEGHAIPNNRSRVTSHNSPPSATSPDHHHTTHHPTMHHPTLPINGSHYPVSPTSSAHLISPTNELMPTYRRTFSTPAVTTEKVRAARRSLQALGDHGMTNGRRPLVNPRFKQPAINKDYNGNSSSNQCSNQGQTVRNNLRVMRSPGTTQQRSSSVSSSQSSPVRHQNIQQYFSEPIRAVQPQSSGQVQQTYWSPMHTPVRVPQSPRYYQEEQFNGTQSSFYTSQQQRQFSLEKVSPAFVRKEKPNPRRETPVWDYFKYYERCATTDF